MNQTTPKKINRDIRLLIETLGLQESEVCQLKMRRVDGFKPIEKYCHVNCIKLKELIGGDIQYGWVIWQDSSKGFTEAEFHAVHINEAGEYSDITPRIDGEKRVMFVPDHERSPALTNDGSKVKIRAFTNHKVLQGQVYEATRECENYLELDKLAKIGVKIN